MTELYQKTLVELRDGLERGEFTSVEIVEALYERSDRVDGALRGYVYQYRERALEDARAADESRERGEIIGPLHGLPITLKENIATAGDAVTMGIAGRMGEIERDDAVVVELLERAGAIVLGKSNLPQTLLSFESVNPIWGRTKNPWSLDRAPGGSSGGESALIASGQSPAGIGTDIGGSIRLPSAFCGICGIKPTARRWSEIGCKGVLEGQKSIPAQCGPMARSVADLGFLLRAIDSPLHSEYDPGVPPMPIGDPGEVDISELRVGFFVDDGFFEPSPAQKRVVRESARILEERGATVVTFHPDGAGELMETYYGLMSSDGGQMMRDALAGEEIVKQVRQLLQIASMPDGARRLASRAMSLAGEPKIALVLGALGARSAEEFWRLTAKRDELRHRAHHTWRRLGLDAVLCPVFPCAPVLHDESHDFTAAACYTMRYNLLDLPAGVVPVSTIRPHETERVIRRDRLEKKAARMDVGSDGLPVCVQVAARRFREDVALAVMGAIEEGARDFDDFPETPVTPHSL
jgi:fatty acid amide hydrolase